MPDSKKTSRRSFIKGVAAFGAGAAVLGAGNVANAIPTPPPKKWNVSTDVIVIGFGGAGAAAAIEADRKSVV